MPQDVWTRLFATMTVLCALSPLALANGGSGVTYHGRLLKPDGSPLQSQSVQFKMQIRTPGNESCVLYEETQTLDMRNSAGVFSISINDGTGTRTDSTGLVIDQVFQNRGSFTLDSKTCAAGSGGTSTTWTPNVSDGRKLQVLFRDETMAQWEQIPAANVNFAPMAIEAKQIGGYRPNNLLRVDDTAASSNTTLLNTTQLNSLIALINGTSTQYVQRNGTTGATMPSVNGAPATLTPGSMWFDTGSNTLKYYDGTSVQVVGSGGGGSGTVTGITIGTGLVDGTGATGTVITTAGTIALPNVGTAGSYYKVTTDAQGRVSSGAAALVEADIPSLTTAGKVSGSAITSGTIGGTTAISTSGNLQTSNDVTAKRIFVQDSGSNYAGLKAPATVPTTYSLTLPTGLPGSSGMVLSSDTSGNLSWVTPSAGSVTSVGVTAPLTSGGTASAPIIGITQSTTTTDGYLSSTDWNTFNNKLSGTLASGKIYVGNGSNVATAVTPSGDVTVTTAGGFTVTQIQGVAVSATLPTTAGQVLRYDGTGSYVPAQLSTSDISGLATALSNKIDSSQMPANCAANQTLTFSSPTGAWTCSSIAITGSAFGSQTQNLVLASPDGSAGNPTFRALSANDIPSLSAAKITSGTLAVAQGGTGTATGSITGTGALTFAAGGSNQNVTLTPSGTGNTILNGNVGVGTTTPGVSLDLGARTDAIALPKGTTAEQPASPAAGMFRYNTSNSLLEFYNGSAWTSLAAAGSGISSLTGDVTATGPGAAAATVVKVNGVSYPASPATNTVPVVTGANTITYQTLPVAAGGTGQTNASAAFNALSPITTAGDLIYGNGANSSTRLAGNATATKQFLSMTSSVPAWGTLNSGDIPWDSPGTIGSTTPNSGVFTSLTSTGYTQSSGNFAMSGTGTFSTGTGAVSLNGATTIAANNNLSMASGSGTFTQTYTGTGTAATITANNQTSGSILSLSSSSTTASAGNNGLGIAIAGANGSASITRTGLAVNVTSTGTTSTNVGAVFGATGATNNYGLIVESGSVGIGITNPTGLLQVGSTAYGLANAVSLGGLVRVGTSGSENGTLQLISTTGRTTSISMSNASDTTISNTDGNINFTPTANTIFTVGNVGIGSTTPGVSLDIGARTDALALPKGTTGQQPGSPAAGWIRYNTTNNAVEFHNGTSWTTLASAGGSYLSTGGGTLSGALTISSGGASITGGVDNNSGGITNAGSITGVGANITGSGAMTVAAGGTAQNLTLSSSTSGSVNIGSGNGTSVQVQDGGASTVNYLRLQGAAAGSAPTVGVGGSDTNIDLKLAPKGTGNSYFASGNVGIGITTPGYGLDVNGTARVTGTSAFNGATSFGASGTNGLLTVYNSVPTVIGQIGAASGIITGGGANLGITGYNGDIVFGGGSSGSTEVMRVKNSGNVGIGTVTPVAVLDVHGANTTTGALGTGVSFQPTVTSDTTGTRGILMQPLINPSTPIATIYGTYLTPQLVSSSQNVTNFVANTIRAVLNSSYSGTVTNLFSLYIQAPVISGGSATNVYGLYQADNASVNYFAGNVGIGTTNPASILHLESASGPTIRLQRSGDLGFAQIASSGGNLYFRSDPGNTEALSNMTFSVDASEAMRISTSGNVGVGTSAPDAKLHVNANTGTVSLLAGTRIHLTGADGALNRLTIDSYGNNLTDDAPSLTLRRSKGLGASPTALTNGTVIGQVDFLGKGATLYDLPGAQIVGVANETWTDTSAAGYLRFMTTASTAIVPTERMRISSNGNVGIGTTTPATTLDVAGSVKVGTDANACSGTLQGALRLNGTALEFCNGTSWGALSSGGSYLATTGGTLSGALAISSGGASITGGVNNNSGGITNAGSITGVGTNITGSSAVTIAAGGTAQDLTLSSSTTGSVNVGSGNGTSLQVQNGGASTVNYITAKGAATGSAPTLGVGGSDANINLFLTPKGTGITAFTDGKVGIGTTVPEARLHLEETSTATSGNIYGALFKETIAPSATSTASVFGQYTLADTTGAGANDINNIRGNMALARHNATGTVANLRAVEGSAQNASTGTVTSLRGGNFSSQTTGPSPALTSSAIGSISSVSNSNSGTITSAVGIQSTISNTGTGSIGSARGVLIDLNNTGGSFNTGYGLFITQSTGVSNPWGIYQQGAVDKNYFAGNIGIGVVSPSTRLQIEGSQTVGTDGVEEIINISRPINSGVSWPVAASISIGKYAASLAPVTRMDFNLKSVSSNDNTTDAKVMTLQSNGNVGIGTTSPSNLLQVVSTATGNANIEIDGNAGTTNTVGLIMDSTTRKWQIGVKGTAESGSLIFYDGTAGQRRLTIDSTGNVGIGTNSPGSRLETWASNPVDSTGQEDVIKVTAGNIGGGANIGGRFGIRLGNNAFLDKAAGIYATSEATYMNQLGLSFYTSSGGGPIYNEKMRITGTGNVGIGTTGPTEKLHIVGNLRVQGSTDCTLGNGSGGTNCSSDIRLKTNIQEIENPLQKILSLRGVEFDWNEKSQSPGDHAIGVIAQDVEKQFPTAVIEDSNTGYKKVDYAVLVAPIIQAFKELNKRITELFSASEQHSRDIASIKAETTQKADKAEIEALKAKNKELERRLELLEKSLKSK